MKNWTQEEFGRKLNISKVTVSSYESGVRTPDAKTLIKIADLFDVSVDYLLGRTDGKNEGYASEVLVSKDEKELLERFRNLSENDAKVLLQLARILERRGRISDELNPVSHITSEQGKNETGISNSHGKETITFLDYLEMLREQRP
ncbi:MAG: helix-turn-helix domain-containing protein [Alicyclobacillus mali]|nr:helix-turn-helix domain-containing protein [Alicyclobacillus mali (ex Roth et al. 2021)]